MTPRRLKDLECDFLYDRFDEDDFAEMRDTIKTLTAERDAAIRDRDHWKAGYAAAEADFAAEVVRLQTTVSAMMLASGVLACHIADLTADEVIRQRVGVMDDLNAERRKIEALLAKWQTLTPSPDSEAPPAKGGA